MQYFYIIVLVFFLLNHCLLLDTTVTLIFHFLLFKVSVKRWAINQYNCLMTSVGSYSDHRVFCYWSTNFYYPSGWFRIIKREDDINVSEGNSIQTTNSRFGLLSRAWQWTPSSVPSWHLKQWFAHAEVHWHHVLSRRNGSVVMEMV